MPLSQQMKQMEQIYCQTNQFTRSLTEVFTEIRRENPFSVHLCAFFVILYVPIYQIY